MTNKTNLTIDDIARELGVSKTTVSRAISGKGRISAATRDRVQAFIELHNYRPSAAAKGLAESRTYNLALVLPRHFINLDLPFYRKSMAAICEEAYLHDYNVMVCVSTDNHNTALMRTLDYRKVDGVILSRTVENDMLLDVLTTRGVPFATLGTLPARNHGAALVEADHDQAEGCRDFTRQILQNSTEKTALLGNDLNYVVNQSRLTGFRRAAQELNLALDQTPIRMGINDLNDCRVAVEDLLKEGVRRFVCMDEDVCRRTCEVLKSNGLTIAKDAFVACFADCEQLEQMDPPISALYFDPAELGQAACRELLNALCNEPYEPKPKLGYQIRMRGSI